MKEKWTRLDSFFCFLIFLFSEPAHAFFLTEYGALPISSPTATSSGQINPGVQLGVGISIGIRVFKSTDFEPGLIYFTRTFELQEATRNTTLSMTVAQLPILLRYWLAESVSLAGGFALTRALAGASFDDFGLVLSTRYRTPFNDMIDFIADARVVLGVIPISPGGSLEVLSRDIQILAGIQFTL